MDRWVGTIAVAERDLMWIAFVLMLFVVVPVILLTLYFAWQYRSGNSRATYSPNWDRSRAVDLFIWGIPSILIVVLATMVWAGTHRLDPYRPLASDLPSTRIQAVAQDWKWLFIYPDQGIATINELAFPQDRPVTFEITSDVAMNSFMIPQLGGQIYAMGGMKTQLNLKADRTGTFEGRNMLYSGDGFSKQTFLAHAMSAEDYEGWINKVKSSDQALTEATYEEVEKPTIDAPVAYFGSVVPNLFETIIASHAGHGMHMDGAAK